MTAFSIDAVSSGASTNPAFAAESTGAQHHNEPATNIIGGQQDTATLSPTARALELFQQGEGVPAIAVTMSTTAATIDTYLHISIPTTAALIASIAGASA